MRLSILILNHNTPKLIKYLLKNINQLNLQFPYEIIVVDNGKKNVLRNELNTQLANITLLEVPNHGFAAGNNAGLGVAQGEYILFLNPDIYIEPNNIEKMLKFMDEHQQVGLLGPQLLYPSGQYQESCLAYPDWRLPFYRRSFLAHSQAGKKWLRHYLLRDYDHKTARPVDWLFGASWLVRQKAITEVGKLDEVYFMYFEDLDWCRRFWQVGWQVWYFPEAKVIHFHHRDSAEKQGWHGLFTKLGRVHLVSWFKYIKKWHSQPIFGANNENPKL
ncbi:MAG: glycosyltransferase family 2 protein [Candidatus Komeilibacteria bacterium]